MLVAAKNQKRCALCALVKAAAWNDGRSHECAGCGREYIAWAGQKTHRLCGYCFIEGTVAGGRDSVRDTCGYHKQGECRSGTDPVWVFDPRLKLCYPCLHDPKLWKPNRAAILRRGKELHAGRS